MTGENQQALDDIRQRLGDIRTDIEYVKRWEPDVDARSVDLITRVVDQIDALAVLIGKTTRNTSAGLEASSGPRRDPRITPVAHDQISRTVRDIKTTRLVVEVITGPGGTVSEVIFDQIGPTSRRRHRHSLTNFIDWARKATVEHYGDD